VGVLSNRPPFDFLQADGRHAGLSEDTLELIRQHTGLQTRTVVADSMADLLQLFRQGDIDLIAAASSYEEGMPPQNLTEPYFVSALGVFVPRGEVFLGDLGGLLAARVAVSRGGYADAALAAYPRIERLQKDTIAKAAQEVLSGEANYLVAETTSALRAIEEAGVLGLSYAGPLAERPMKLHLAVHPRWAGLRPALNATLAGISNEEAARIRRHWVGAVVEGGIAPAKVAVWGALLAMLAGLGYLAFYWHNRRLREEMALRARVSRQLAEAQRARDDAEQRFRTMVDTSPNA
jgi:two-component system, NarL family, sensor histidine kinase EvgS